MYETSGVLNEEVIKESKVHVISSKRRKFFIIFSIIMVLCGLSQAILWVVTSDIYYISSIASFGTLAIISISIPFFVQNLFQKRNMQTIKELSGTNSLKVRTIFSEDGVVINNFNASSEIEIKYEFFVRLEETPNLYILITKSGQYYFIFKNCLNDGEINSFKDFIKENCKNIK